MQHGCCHGNLVVLNVGAWKPENTPCEMQNGISTHQKKTCRRCEIMSNNR